MREALYGGDDDSRFFDAAYYMKPWLRQAITTRVSPDQINLCCLLSSSSSNHVTSPSVAMVTATLLLVLLQQLLGVS